MERRLTFVAVLLVFACTKEETQLGLHSQETLTAAWTGESEDGVRVVLEHTFRAPGPEKKYFSEQDLLIKAFGLEKSDSLVRLHLVGAGSALQGSGSLQSSSGQIFDALNQPPRGLSPRARNLWIGLAQGGGESTAAQTRRTFLFKTNRPEISADLLWSRGEMQVNLKGRLWDGKGRLEYLTPALNEKDG